MYERRTHRPLPTRRFVRRIAVHAAMASGVSALYAGLVFLVVTGLILVPFAHRLLHEFHWETTQEKS